MKTITNRYGDNFQFIGLENGNVLWSGNFEYHRVGYKNNYDEAYSKYLDTCVELEDIDYNYLIDDPNGNCTRNFTKEEFIKILHNNDSVISEKYCNLVTSTNTIEMVDPSGGPYLIDGMEFEGKIIDHFISCENGYEIVFK